MRRTSRTASKDVMPAGLSRARTPVVPSSPLRPEHAPGGPPHRRVDLRTSGALIPAAPKWRAHIGGVVRWPGAHAHLCAVGAVFLEEHGDLHAVDALERVDDALRLLHSRARLVKHRLG